MSTTDFEADNRGYEDDTRYDRGHDESRSPRGDMRGAGESRARSASPNGHDRGDNRSAADGKNDEAAANPGTNLFVTGIHPRLSEAEVTQLFEKYGEVEKCNIMRDPHSGDSRGFGFVKMVTADAAEAAREGLQGMIHEGRTLSIEKARRARPRSPTPGKYYGPPKREFGRPRGGGGRYEDRRGGYGGGGYGGGRRDDYYGGRRDDYYGGSGGSGGGGSGGGYRGYRGDRHDDRGDSYDRRYRERDNGGRPERHGSGGGPPRDDRYGRDERYGRDDRRGGASGGGGGGGSGGGGTGGYYGRDDLGYEQPPPRDTREGYSSGGRGYDRGDDGYSRG